MLTSFRADLHVHTVLSPCAQIEMIPPLIVQRALENHIHLIAITDHNASANIIAVQKAASGTELIVLPGMELQTREEVHVLCLFDTLDQISTFQNFVDEHLPDLKNNPDFFGEQFVVDETGEFIRSEEKLLLISTNIDFKEAWYKVNELGGLFIPAHVNRKAFGLLENLGLVPDDIPIEALEISRHLKFDQAYQLFPQLRGYPLIQNGDVHGIDEFLGSTYFTIAYPNIDELRKAIKGQSGRKVKLST
jgi:3',5'-nucleoside bisphosphate phosphatase